MEPFGKKNILPLTCHIICADYDPPVYLAALTKQPFTHNTAAVYDISGSILQENFHSRFNLGSKQYTRHAFITLITLSLPERRRGRSTLGLRLRHWKSVDTGVEGGTRSSYRGVFLRLGRDCMTLKPMVKVWVTNLAYFQS